MEIKLDNVYNCDCRELMKEMIKQNIKVDCIVTDPPYLMQYMAKRKDKTHKFCKPILGDDDEQLIIDYIELCYQILKDDSAIYLFCNSNKIDVFKMKMEQVGFNIKNIIIWVKDNGTMGDLEAQFAKQYEFIIYANKGRAKFNPQYKRLTDVWNMTRVSKIGKIHQNQKPLELIERMVMISSRPGELVFDGFMGSFTTAVACHNLDRRYLGAELDKDEYEAGRERLENTLAQATFFTDYGHSLEKASSTSKQESLFD